MGDEANYLEEVAWAEESLRDYEMDNCLLKKSKMSGTTIVKHLEKIRKGYMGPQAASCTSQQKNHDIAEALRVAIDCVKIVEQL